jgi:hypothetical protein
MMQQAHSHAGPASNAALLTTSQQLVTQLAALQRLSRAMTAAGPAPPPAVAGQEGGEGGGQDAAAVRDVTLPPEVIAYVQDGRNPDIYTREFVELAMRNNQRLKGKADAFSRFADLLGEEIVGACPEARVHVERVLGDGFGAGGEAAAAGP